MTSGGGEAGPGAPAGNSGPMNPALPAPAAGAGAGPGDPGEQPLFPIGGGAANGRTESYADAVDPLPPAAAGLAGHGAALEAGQAGAGHPAPDQMCVAATGLCAVGHQLP